MEYLYTGSIVLAAVCYFWTVICLINTLYQILETGNAKRILSWFGGAMVSLFVALMFNTYAVTHIQFNPF